MAETGIMGSSGEFRTNAKNSSGGPGGGGLIGQAAGMIAESGARRQRMSHEQFLAVAHHASIKAQGKQVRKTMKKSAELQTGFITHAKKSGLESASSNMQTGELSFKIRAPRQRNATAAPAAEPAKPATTRTPSKWNARNPHPNNPFAAGTKEHKSYNVGTSSQRSSLTRRYKQGMK